MHAFNLELYEKEGVLFPVARVIKPVEYVISRSKLDRQPETYGTSLSGWEDLERLLYVSPKLQHQTDEDLWHPFDLEAEHGNHSCIFPLGRHSILGTLSRLRWNLKAQLVAHTTCLRQSTTITIGRFTKSITFRTNTRSSRNTIGYLSIYPTKSKTESLG